MAEAGAQRQGREPQAKEQVLQTLNTREKQQDEPTHTPKDSSASLYRGLRYCYATGTTGITCSCQSVN